MESSEVTFCHHANFYDYSQKINDRPASVHKSEKNSVGHHCESSFIQLCGDCAIPSLFSSYEVALLALAGILTLKFKEAGGFRSKMEWQKKEISQDISM